jgi:hypothetical protein
MSSSITLFFHKKLKSLVNTLELSLVLHSSCNWMNIVEKCPMIIVNIKANTPSVCSTVSEGIQNLFLPLECNNGEVR